MEGTKGGWMLGSPPGAFGLHAEASLGGGALSLVSWLACEPPTPPFFGTRPAGSR